MPSLLDALRSPRTLTLIAILSLILLLQFYILSSTSSSLIEEEQEVPVAPSPSDPSSDMTLLNPAPKKQKTSLRVAFFTTGLQKKWHFMASYQANSTNKYFCADRPWVHTDYFIFTDGDRETMGRWIPDKDLLSRIHLIPKVSKGWPYNTEERYNWMVETITRFPVEYDYIFWQDADLMYAQPFCEDIMGELMDGVLMKRGATLLLRLSGILIWEDSTLTTMDKVLDWMNRTEKMAYSVNKHVFFDEQAVRFPELGEKKKKRGVGEVGE
ncbi:hypothetical protein HDU67_008866, partial [Dinochytrium kinnereticum]